MSENGNILDLCFDSRHGRRADASTCGSGPVSGNPGTPFLQEPLRPISGWNARRHFSEGPKAPSPPGRRGFVFILDKNNQKNANLLLTRFQDECIRALPTAQRRSAASRGRFWSLPLLDRIRWRQLRYAFLRVGTFSTRLTIRLRTDRDSPAERFLLVWSFSASLRRQPETKTPYRFRVMASLFSFGDVDDSLRVHLRDREGSAACLRGPFPF